VRPHFGADHDYPPELVKTAAKYLPFDATPIREIDRRLVDRFDDWQVLLALHQLGFAGLITLDAEMLDLPREMAVLHQIKGTLVVIEAAGHNPLRAFGQLLVHMTSIAAQYQAEHAQVFRIPEPRTVHPTKPWGRLGLLATAQGLSTQQLFDSVKVATGGSVLAG
jgi:hypothetical protein